MVLLHFIVFYSNFAIVILILFYMKKAILFLILFLACVIPMSAEKRNVELKFTRVDNKPINPDLRSVIINLPIEATIDDTTGYLEVTSSSSLSGSVYVYSISGTLERSASKLNVTLPIPQRRQTHILTIKGDDWSGEGKFIY